MDVATISGSQMQAAKRGCCVQVLLTGLYWLALVGPSLPSMPALHCCCCQLLLHDLIQQRQELIGAVDFSQRQLRLATEQEAVVSSQDVTASLRRTKQLMTQNVEQTIGNIDVLGAWCITELQLQVIAVRKAMVGVRASTVTALATHISTLTCAAFWDLPLLMSLNTLCASLLLLFVSCL